MVMFTSLDRRSETRSRVDAVYTHWRSQKNVLVPLAVQWYRVEEVGNSAFLHLPFPFRPRLLSPFSSVHFPISSPFPSRLLFLTLEVGPFKYMQLCLGERYKLPQRGLGRSSSRNRIWCILGF